jgi:hypothetical protein
MSNAIEKSLRRKIFDSFREPIRALIYFYWRIFGNLHCIPSKIYFENQYEEIHSDVLKDEKFLIVILDACRFDFLFSQYEEFFRGDVKPVYSSARDTFEYLRNTWEGDHKELMYVSGALPVRDVYQDKDDLGREDMWGGYVTGNHLRIDDVVEDGWSDELGTVPPEEVTEKAMEELPFEDKMVVHYFQPHDPYIGEFGVFDGESMFADLDGLPESKIVWEMFKNGEISRGKMMKAYRSNLRLVLKEVQKLVEASGEDRRVVITSDHGEVFGEGGVYAHPRVQHPKLRVVPWLEVEDVR